MSFPYAFNGNPVKNNSWMPDNNIRAWRNRWERPKKFWSVRVACLQLTFSWFKTAFQDDLKVSEAFFGIFTVTEYPILSKKGAYGFLNSCFVKNCECTRQNLFVSQYSIQTLCLMGQLGKLFRPRSLPISPKKIVFWMISAGNPISRHTRTLWQLFFWLL